MRDTTYATLIKQVSDHLGQRIERLYVKEQDVEEIRFSWWKDGRMVVRPLDLPEDELLPLLADAIAEGVFSEDFMRGLQTILNAHLGDGEII